jgi:hypothetical protein
MSDGKYPGGTLGGVPLFNEDAGAWEGSPREGICPLVKPDRPYIAVEYWRNGRRLSEEDGHVLVGLAFTEENAHA